MTETAPGERAGAVSAGTAAGGVAEESVRAAGRYALNQWVALTRLLEYGELEIDNGATERVNREIAMGRGNWTFFGSDGGGKTAAVLRSFIASCKR